MVVTCWNVSLHVTLCQGVLWFHPLDMGVHQEDKTICDNKVVTSYLGSVKRRWDMVRLCRQPRWRYQQHEAIMAYLVDFSWEVVGSGWFSLTLRCWVKPPTRWQVDSSWGPFGTSWYILVHVLKFLPQWTMWTMFSPYRGTIPFWTLSRRTCWSSYWAVVQNKLTYHVTYYKIF